MATTFKQSLTEERSKDLAYKEKYVKGEIDRVTVALEGKRSAKFTRLAKRYYRLKDFIERMSKKLSELNPDLKEEMDSLFDATDVVYTRVIDTLQFTMTLSKQVSASGYKTVTDYEKVADALAQLVGTELEGKVTEIYAQFTKTIPNPAKSPALRLHDKTGKALEEGLLGDVVSKLRAFLTKIQAWGRSYDTKLAQLKSELAK